MTTTRPMTPPDDAVPISLMPPAIRHPAICRHRSTRRRGEGVSGVTTAHLLASEDDAIYSLASVKGELADVHTCHNPKTCLRQKNEALDHGQ